VTLAELCEGLAAWLDGSGPRSDLVLSSRVRLARNVANTPFPNRANGVQLGRAFHGVAAASADVPSLASATTWNLEDLATADRPLLVERHLVSPNLLEGTGERGVIVADGERQAVMINEEDHVRIQCVASGFQLAEVLSEAVALDRGLEERIEFAASRRHGYLTACPTNAGTGLRASVWIHLPGLALVGETKRIHRSVAEMGMAVRGWFGEGTSALGDFYQLSNQQTLGRTEERAVEELGAVAERVLGYELEAREKLASSDRRAKLEDRIFRSEGILRCARLLTVSQVMACTSDLRLGRALGLVQVSDRGLNRLALFSQPAHLAKRMGCPQDGESSRWERARWVRAEMDSIGFRPRVDEEPGQGSTERGR